MNASGNQSTKLGLSLISSYSDCEDDEENISIKKFRKNEECSKDNNKETVNLGLNNPVVSNRLPLPSTITKLFESNHSANRGPKDDPTQHDGRRRSFPHQRGNWSTYVYVPYEPGDGFEELIERLSTVTLETDIQLKAVSHLHISLTRTVVLLHHWIDSFVSSVRSKLFHHARFTLMLGPPEVYCNDERTRTFLGLKVHTGSKYLYEMSQTLDGCLAEFRLPPFYKDPQFHMSVLWAVGDVRDALEALLPQFQVEFDLHASENPNSFCIDVTQCLCKTGYKMYTFPLASL